jgi:hypothetical protein
MNKKILFQIIDFLKKYNIFFVSAIFLCTYSFLGKSLLKGNEIDVLVTAKHFMNKSWIPNDWYLNLNIDYRNLFNIIAGSISLVFPLWVVAVIGRIITSILFSFVIYKFAKLFNIKTFLVLIFLFVWYNFFDSLVAGEWILKGFDTKSFAYIFSLLSLYYAVKNNYLKMFLFSGLSISFHVLVGIYSLFCIFIAIIINIKYHKLYIKNIIKSVYAFFITGFYGIFIVIKMLFINQNVDKKLASLIYVCRRVSHHVLPSSWEGYIWIIKFIVMIIFTILVFILINDKRFKMLSVFILSSSLLFTIGLTLFKLNKIELLKFYWFRLPDVIMPLLSLFLLFCLIQRYLYVIYININIKNLFKKIINTLSVIAIIIIIFICFKDIFFITKKRMKENKNYTYKNVEKNFENALIWINKNTPEDCTVLSYPFIDEIYIITERATFVSYKHSPQSEKDILEWYDRLKLCNDDINTNDINLFLDNFNNRFYNLRIETLQKIIKKYNINYYIGKAGMNYPYEIVYKNNEYAIYKLN